MWSIANSGYLDICLSKIYVGIVKHVRKLLISCGWLYAASTASWLTLKFQVFEVLSTQYIVVE